MFVKTRAYNIIYHPVLGAVKDGFPIIERGNKFGIGIRFIHSMVCSSPPKSMIFRILLTKYDKEVDLSMKIVFDTVIIVDDDEFDIGKPSKFLLNTMSEMMLVHIAEFNVCLRDIINSGKFPAFSFNWNMADCHSFIKEIIDSGEIENMSLYDSGLA